MTAGEIVDRIKKNLGLPWRDQTYRDTFKFGGPETEVKGIATTVFCSYDLVRRAGAAGLNMIIPHEDTYWNDRDDVSMVSGDPLYKTKVDFMREHNIVVFRIHDHMHAQRPDFLYEGLARELALTKYETAPNSHRFVVPETTLGALAAELQKRSGARALRVVGDPNAKVSRLQLGVGYATPPAVINPEVDVLISGEQQEADGGLDSPAYVLDALALGMAKGWIMLGHAISEEPGMHEMARWIKGFVPEIPVQLVRAGEPFWAPK
jgi:putative NIF3 family GTP cyclohydrolase 1 type 2